jgi:hypothetical protein
MNTPTVQKERQTAFGYFATAPSMTAYGYCLRDAEDLVSPDLIRIVAAFRRGLFSSRLP